MEDIAKKKEKTDGPGKQRTQGKQIIAQAGGQEPEKEGSNERMKNATMDRQRREDAQSQIADGAIRHPPDDPEFDDRVAGDSIERGQKGKHNGQGGKDQLGRTGVVEIDVRQEPADRPDHGQGDDFLRTVHPRAQAGRCQEPASDRGGAKVRFEIGH